jgi:hypothetical protein
LLCVWPQTENGAFPDNESRPPKDKGRIKGGM